MQTKVGQVTPRRISKDIPNDMWVVLEIRVLFLVPQIVRHPSEKDPKREPNLEENYSYEV